MNKKALRTGLLCLVAGTSLGATSPAFANLIVNGDFNAGIGTWQGWTKVGNISHVTQSGPPFWFGAGTAAENGPGVMAFNAGNTTPNGVLSQTFGTVAGQSYALHFDFGVTENGTSATVSQTLIAAVLGADGLIPLGTWTVSDSNSPTLPNNLNHYDFAFIADGAAATLRFSDVASNGTFNFDGVLDNVSVIGPAPAQLPEPATLGLFGLALAGLALRRKPKRHRA